MPERGTEEEFARWLADVNRLVAARFGGITLDDLPDMMTRDAFDNGTTPEQFFGDDVLTLIREEFGNEATEGGDDD